MDYAKEHLTEFVPFILKCMVNHRYTDGFSVMYSFFHGRVIWVHDGLTTYDSFNKLVTRDEFLAIVVEDSIECADEIKRVRMIDALGGKVISLEGNIGVGKSTLAELLERSEGKFTLTDWEHGKEKFIHVYKEPTNQKFLKIFYDNPDKYAFAFQLSMVKTRLYQAALARRDNIPNGKQMFVWDRSMVGDYVFSVWNYLLGKISTEEMEVYEFEFGTNFSNIHNSEHTKHVSVFVFLDDDPAQCKKRVEEMRKNDSEKNIPLDYYTGIDDIHFSLCMKLCASPTLKVTVLNWGKYDDNDSVISHLMSVVKKERKFPKVEFMSPLVTGFIPCDNYILYQSAESIYSDYQRLDEFEKMTEFHVYVSRRICVIPEEKLTARGIVRAPGASRFDITFYENEYKRVIMRHLACGRSVEFI